MADITIVSKLQMFCLQRKPRYTESVFTNVSRFHTPLSYYQRKYVLLYRGRYF